MLQVALLWEKPSQTKGLRRLGFPVSVPLSDFDEVSPELPEELIKGVLRCGHKMLVSGSSKAGKSFLLMELCVSIVEGIPWLGFPVKKGRVMYINLEIDPASCIHRFKEIYKTLGIEQRHTCDIEIWNLRGHAVPLDELVPKIVSRLKGKRFDAFVLDPIYKVITGDENNASDMGRFCNQFDKICLQTGCAAIYCHHHSKGTQGQKRAIDRASGSGVFARDPDAQLDMIQLKLSEDIKNNLRDGDKTAWRLEGSLREFPLFPPVNFWFRYPVHVLDEENLRSSPAEGSLTAGRQKNRCRVTKEEKMQSVRNAYAACSITNPVTVKDMAEYAEVTERCMRDRIKQLSDEFFVKNGIVWQTESGK